MDQEAGPVFTPNTKFVGSYIDYIRENLGVDASAHLDPSAVPDLQIVDDAIQVAAVPHLRNRKWRHMH